MQTLAGCREHVRGLSSARKCGFLQIDKNLKSLERCQSLEEIQRLYEAGDYEAVVQLLRPTLCTSGFDRAKHLEFMTSIPERPAQLLLLQVRAALPCPPLPSPLLCSAWAYSLAALRWPSRTYKTGSKTTNPAAGRMPVSRYGKEVGTWRTGPRVPLRDSV